MRGLVLAVLTLVVFALAQVPDHPWVSFTVILFTPL